MPATTKVSELTPAQWTSWCEANAEAFRRDMLQATCTFTGLAAAQAGRGTCEAARDACRTDVASSFDCERAPAAGDGGAETCSASVGELQKCYDDLIDAIKPLLSGLSCSSNLADLASKLQTLGNLNPGSCTIVATKCPGYAPSLGADDK
ncbi:MAG: hypothetical protein IPL40_08480 [Proteobacteria bacterium]|nr:hypothetical protein [Pseudomonadota bacterium]